MIWANGGLEANKTCPIFDRDDDWMLAVELQNQPKPPIFGMICLLGDMDVSKNKGKTPKMDGENNGKPY